jgi:hypothetical protein
VPAYSDSHCCQFLNIHGFSVVKPAEIHKLGPPVPEPSASEVEMAAEKLKRCKSLGTDQTAAELMTAYMSVQCVRRSVNILIVFGIRKNSLQR